MLLGQHPIHLTACVTISEIPSLYFRQTNARNFTDRYGKTRSIASGVRTSQYIHWDKGHNFCRKYRWCCDIGS
jgi:hypothetical protein